jgi:hypothetical protein
MTIRARSLKFVLCLAMGTSWLFGQSTATIVGTVTDPSGAVISGAQVTVTNTGTGQERTVTTNSSGAYQAPQLQIGAYSVSATAPGFKKYEATNIVLNVNDTIRVDASLQVGQATESITVSADIVQVQSDTNEQSDLISGKQVTQLALNGRNITQLTTLGTGATTTSGDFLVPSGLTGNATISFNGQRPAHNLYLVDGGENYDRGGGGGISTMPSPDAIAEFKALTSNYSAEFGQGSGGTMTMVLKSGTREFHGTAWEFLRNNAFDAANYFANRNSQPQPVLKYNTFGYNLSGPIYIPGVYNKDRNKTFFFWNEEWRKLRQGTQSQTIKAFPQAWRDGNFSSLTGVQLVNPITKAPYAGNQIPTSSLDKNALAFLAAGTFPLPNSANNNFTLAPTVPTDVREEIIKIDHHLTDKLSLMGSYIQDLTEQTTATPLWGNSSDYPSLGTTINSPSRAAVIRLTATITPSMVNELAYSYNGNRITLSPKGVFERPSNFTVPEYFSANNDNRLPVVNVAGNYGVYYNTNSWPWYNSFDSNQIRDDMSITRGNHNIKFGGSFMRTRKNQDIFGQTQGGFTFNGNATGDAFADFMLGYASSYHELAVQDRLHVRTTTFGAYIVDNWRVNNRLTLNLGLRWEGVPHAYELYNRMSNFLPENYSYGLAPQFNSDGSLNSNGPGFTKVPGIPLANTPFYLNGISISGIGGYRRSLVQNSWANFAPRVGFAFDLFGTGKTFIRSGFGIFYERIQGNDIYNMGPNPPFSYDASAQNVLFSNPSVNYLTGSAAATPVFPGGLTTLAFSDYKLPTSMQWSFGIQHQLSRAAVLNVSYVGNGNYHQPAVRNINTVGLNNANRAQIANGTFANPNTQRIYPGYADINMTEAATGSNYNSLQIGFRAEAFRGLTFQGSYTWSHVFDYVSGDLDALSNPFDRSFNYGPANFDRRHIATFNYVYELPFFANRNPGIVKTALGGWVVSGITTFQSGTPLTPTVSDSGKQLGLNGGNTTARPNIVSDVNYAKDVDSWFSTTSFVQPSLLSFGSSPKGSIVSPGRNNWNLSLFKNFALGFREGARVEFRAETFNTFNHTQFHDVNVSLGNSNFGKVTSAWDARVMQLGLKLLF